jgi:4-hydroxy-tetrahydrodipicolinate reductase
VSAAGSPAITVAVSGAAGRMGQAVCAAVESADDLDVCARADPALGISLEAVLEQSRPAVVVDFTTPEAGYANARLCLTHGVHAVVGTTGISESEMAEIAALAAASEANCFIAPNFALGAVLMMQAAKLVAPHMIECEIVELHHADKRDAPSGTAKRTAALIAEAGGRQDVPIHSVRLPGLVAHQEVIFGGLGQTLTIRHDSISRESFMPGVLLAIRRVATLDGLVVGLENLL